MFLFFAATDGARMSEKIKRADSGIPDVSAHRELAPHEEDALAAGKSRWLPRIFQSYGTPIPELMASPLKTGLIFGVPAGLLGAGLGSALGGKQHSGMGALIGGLGAGGLAAIAAGMDREAKNEGLEELMRRMPEGAAKRDLLADPQYQSDFLGWDNNKIVATARARYYRPTERFSKRTFDMADARARYNERHKSSSVNSVNKDVSMNQNEKQAMFGFGVPAGALAGLVTSKKNKRLRAVGRGALKGLGSDVGSMMGAVPGALLGGGLGLIGGPLGAGAGAGIGALLGGAGGSYLGANTMNEVLGPYETERETAREENEENKKAAQALLDNTTLTLAEKMAAYANLLKKQANSPTMAASIPPMAGPAMSAPAGFDPSNMQMPTSPTTGQPMNAPDAPTPTPAPAPARSGGGSAELGDYTGVSNIMNSETLKHLFGVGDRRSTLYDHTVAPAGKLLSFIGQKGQDAVGAGAGAGRSLLKWLKPDAPPPPSMLDQLKPYAPYAAIGAGGLGAIALADYMSRRNQKKKRPQSDEDEGEYSMPKAANINWYALARQRQKYAMSPAVAKPIVSVLPNILARLSGAASSARAGLSRAGTYMGEKALNLPPWALPAGGTAAGVGGVYGLSKLLGGGKDPSMLQQIMNSKYTPYAAAGLGTAGLLGGAAYLGSRAGKTEAKKKKPAAEKQSNVAAGAGLGALAGGGLGALTGALAPGYETDPDSGRRRRRSRLMAALRGLAAGGVAGGLGGAAVGHFAPGATNSMLDRMGMGKELELPPPPTGAENMAQNVAQMNPQQRKLHDVIMQRNKIKAPPTPDPVELARAQATVNSMGEEPGMNDVTGAPNPAMAAQMAQQ